MTKIQNLTPAEKQCLSDFLRIAVGNNLPCLSEYDISNFSKDFTIPPIFIKKFLNQLVIKSIIYRVEDSNRFEYHISDEYLDEIYNFAEEKAIISGSFDSNVFNEVLEIDIVPGSDRFVLRSDNEEAAQSAINNLNDLSERIKVSNEFNADPDERLALSKEITALTSIIEGSKIRVASIKNAITGSGILRWLASQATDATINALATQVISFLSKICGLV